MKKDEKQAFRKKYHHSASGCPLSSMTDKVMIHIQTFRHLCLKVAELLFSTAAFDSAERLPVSSEKIISIRILYPSVPW